MSEQLKVWWIPQIPGTSFDVPVASVEEAKKILTVLANYDLFQYENRIKGDYCNAGGLLILDGDEWIDWYDEEGRDISELMEEE